MIRATLYFFFSYLLTLAVTANAQQVITFNNTSEIIPIGSRIFILEDETKNLTLEQILTPEIQARFKISQQNIPNFANTRSAIWCRLTVANTTSEKCLLQIEKSLIHHIDFYRPLSNGTYEHKTVGALHPIKARDIKDNFFIFHLLPAHTTNPQTFYIRFESEESLTIPMSIGTSNEIFNEHQTEELLFGAFYGLMLALIIYNLFIYTTIGEKFYLYYVFYTISMLFLNDMIITGIGFEFLWPNFPQLNFYANAFTALVYIVVIKFSSSFLNTVNNTPQLHRGLYFFYLVSAVIIIMNVAGDFFISSLISQGLGFLLGVYLIIIGLASYKKEVNAASFYLIGWGLFLFCGIIYVLFLNGLLPANKFTENATIIGSALEGTLLSLALANRINILRREKIKAQFEKLQLIEDQKNKLEHLVTERTHEIVVQNEEIASQNEELVTQQDQITIQNEELQNRNRELESAKKIIEQQHASLIRYSENLEHEINMRAKDLVKSNQELVEQNHQLEQFAFITAHNLRAPVARIQGLASILDLTSEETEKHIIIGKMIQSSQELDRVIHDLAKILEIRKGTVDNFENVNLYDKMDRVNSMLQDQIRKTGAVIYCDFNAVRKIFSLPQYIESILYNLISNAIKYKSQERSPIIRIESLKKDNNILIIIKDNGIGLEMDRYREKIFGLYQRFHDHVEGKGLGLHLVKTQVESLGGKIEIESQPNVGTTFTITLPGKN